MKKNLIVFLFLLTSLISGAQVGSLDFKSGGLGLDAMFARLDASVFNTDAGFSYGGGHRLVAGDAGFMPSGAISFSGLARYKFESLGLHASLGPSFQYRNKKTGLGGVLSFNLKKEVGPRSFLLAEMTLEAGKRLVYTRGGLGIMVGKTSLFGGVETTHDGLFLEFRQQITSDIYIGASYIEASEWYSNEGVKRQDGFAINIGAKF